MGDTVYGMDFKHKKLFTVKSGNDGIFTDFFNFPF